jgi:hypothetical protein
LTGPRILIGCEKSGRVRDAFIKRGYNAWSCDLEPSWTDGPHIRGDIRDVMRWGWDGAILHPECTKLTVAAAWCMYHPDDEHLPYADRRPHPDFPDRRQEQDEAAEFFMACIDAPIPLIAVENSVGVMSTRYRKPDQIIQPYQFGDDASKKTCLWLKGFSKLPIDPALRVPGRMVPHPTRAGVFLERWSNQTDSGQNRLGPSEDRSAKRAETYPGIANAFAEHWGPEIAGELRLAA